MKRREHLSRFVLAYRLRVERGATQGDAQQGSKRGANMQPLNWDTAARTKLADPLNLFTGSETLRQPGSESFGDHLYRSHSAPGNESLKNEPARADVQANPPPPPPPAPPAKPTSATSEEYSATA